MLQGFIDESGDLGYNEGYFINSLLISHNPARIKNLQTQNLRDHMTEEELIFTALAELSTRRISEKDQTIGLEENKIPAKKGGKIAKDARVALENTIGESVVTGQNFLPASKVSKLP